ncbi:MAG: tRNA-dihydrouridine synthase [Steroidobacteraceae bacterium]
MRGGDARRGRRAGDRQDARRRGRGAGAATRARLAAFDEAAYQRLARFTDTVAQAGCGGIVHAREAVLGGLSPKENREVPPLRPEVAERLKRDFPSLEIVLNGGLRTAARVEAALRWSDGVMLGRGLSSPRGAGRAAAALRARRLYRPLDARRVLERMAGAPKQMRGGEPLGAITRHMLGLRSGMPGARAFRRLLSEGARRAVDPELCGSPVAGWWRAARPHSVAGAGAYNHADRD